MNETPPPQNPSDPPQEPGAGDSATSGPGAGPTTGQRPPAPANRRLTRRHESEAEIGGVASGIADYFNIDPTLVRIGFVVAAFFNGIGLIAYLILWAVVPEREPSGPVSDSDDGVPTWLWVILAIAGAVAIGGFAIGGQPALLIAAAVVAVGVLIVRSDTSRQRAASTPVPTSGADQWGEGWGTPPTQRYGPATPGSTAVTAPAAPPPAPAPPPSEPQQPPSPLGGITMGLAILSVGVLAAINAGDSTIRPVAWVAVPLAILGVGLLVGALAGRARWLIGWGIALSLVVLPIGAAEGAFREWTGDDFTLGAGSYRESPANIEDLRSSYGLTAGEIRVDLSDVDPDDLIGEELAVNVLTGEIRITVPADVAVTVDARAAIGEVRVLNQTTAGINPSPIRTTDPQGAGDEVFTISARVGAGAIRIERAP